MKIKTILKNLKRGDVVSIDWIDKAVKLALAHSKNSQVTKRYTRPRVADLRTLMNGLAGRITEAGGR